MSCLEPIQTALHWEFPVPQESWVYLAFPLWPQNLRRNFDPLRLPVWIRINLSISLHGTGAWYRLWRRALVDAAGQESSLILRESRWYWASVYVFTWESFLTCVALVCDPHSSQWHLSLSRREHRQRTEHEQLQRPSDPRRLPEQCWWDGYRLVLSVPLGHLAFGQIQSLCCWVW